MAVIAVGREGARTGLTATAVCSLSDDPPSLLICVNQAASAHGVIQETGAFSVNMLASDQADVAAKFAGAGGIKGEQRFLGDPWETGLSGAPRLRSALASLDCRVVDAHAFATHSIFLATVIGGDAREEASPLIYLRGSFTHVASPDA